MVEAPGRRQQAGRRNDQNSDQISDEKAYEAFKEMRRLKNARQAQHADVAESCNRRGGKRRQHENADVPDRLQPRIDVAVAAHQQANQQIAAADHHAIEEMDGSRYCLAAHENAGERWSDERHAGSAPAGKQDECQREARTRTPRRDRQAAKRFEKAKAVKRQIGAQADQRHEQYAPTGEQRTLQPFDFSHSRSSRRNCHLVDNTEAFPLTRNPQLVRRSHL
ncbi:MAG: hypothetical protein APF80_13995 [Alphaproteobacteria bacterium BRH_c36]|nr:MAG: hypothetical protein APF80_13995 [Alphaproteobacteria bacterium BRH_c36]